jgi:thiosulfate/3-mercaptopyruvate sulfurtransferase
MSAPFLIEPRDLAAALQAGAMLMDARKREHFMHGHIPGAIPYSTYDEFVPDTTLDGMKQFVERLAPRLGMLGATLDRPIVVYEDDTGMRAAREAWIFEYLGHRNVRILHGGMRQWMGEGGRPVVGDEIKTVRPKRFLPLVASGNFAGADEVARRSDSPMFTVIDVRDDLEWAGKDDTPCCARRGRIPRAVHIEWTEFLEGGRFKLPEAILASLTRRGIDPNAEIALYCHRGARSAAAYFALRHAGCAGARNYIGSWHEWSAREELPVDPGSAA